MLGVVEFILALADVEEVVGPVLRLGIAVRIVHNGHHITLFLLG